MLRLSGPVTFTPGNWSAAQQITVSGVLEGNATISHTVTSDDAGYSALTPDSVAVTVTPYAKTYTITREVTATEGRSAPLVITLGEAAPTYGLTFEIKENFETPATGKAQAADIVSVQRTLTVLEGNTEVRAWIPTVANDLAGEENETFTVSIERVHVRNIPVPEWKADPGGTVTATVTIEDGPASIAFGEDGASTVNYAVSVAENVPGGTLNVPVTVNQLPIVSTAFKIEVAGTSTATAYSNDANPGDYRIADKTVTFGPADSSRTRNVVITITDDAEVETPETIELSIAAGANPAVTVGDSYARDAAGATATITINSDEAAAGSTKTYTLLDDPSAREGEDAELTVTLGENAPAGGLVFSVSYDYTVSLASPADTGATPSTVTVEAGSSTATLSVPIARDGAEDDGETFTATITTSAPGWAVAGDGTSTATVTITDTTEAISYSAGGYTVIEGSAAHVVVTRTGPTEDEATFKLLGFSAGRTRGLGFLSNTFTIPAGASVATVTLQTKDDAKVEGDGFYGLYLQRPSAGYRLAGDKQIYPHHQGQRRLRAVHQYLHPVRRRHRQRG